MPFEFTEVPAPVHGPVLQAIASWAAARLGIPVPVVRFFEPASEGDETAFMAPSPVLGRSSADEPYTVWMWAGLPEFGSEYATRNILHEVYHQWQFAHEPHADESVRDRWEQEADAFATSELETLRDLYRNAMERKEHLHVRVP